MSISDRPRQELCLQDDDGALVFTYRDDYLQRDDHRQISVSMPLDDKPYPDRIARPYFSGLLPDENARRRLAENLGISESNPFGLLEVIGGECAAPCLCIMPAKRRPTKTATTSTSSHRHA